MVNDSNIIISIYRIVWSRNKMLLISLVQHDRNIYINKKKK